MDAPGVPRMGQQGQAVTILCLGSASLGSAHTGTSCSKQSRTLPVALSWQGSGRGAVLAVVQPAVLRLSWEHKGEQGSSVSSVTALLGDA